MKREQFKQDGKGRIDGGDSREGHSAVCIALDL